jgi:hypothetical protein
MERQPHEGDDAHGIHDSAVRSPWGMRVGGMHAPSLREHRWRLKADNRCYRWTLRDGSGLAHDEQPRRLGVDAGEPGLGVAGGATGDGAEGADGAERLPGLLGLGEVARVVRDDEGVVQMGGEGARAFGQAPSSSRSAWRRARSACARSHARTGASASRPRASSASA